MTTVDVDPAPLSDAEQDLLRALSRALVFLPRVFVADLGREHGLSMSEYFTLMHLSEARPGRLRMGELAAATALSLGAVTRVVTLLEAKGLVERAPHAADARVRDVALSAGGRDRLDAARPSQVASVRRRIFDKLDGVDLVSCAAVLARISEETSTPPARKKDQE